MKELAAVSLSREAGEGGEGALVAALGRDTDKPGTKAPSLPSPACTGEGDEYELDATGLRCPLPVLRARRALRDLPAGAVLTVRATDKGAPREFRAFCDLSGDTLLESVQDGESFLFRIRKAGPAPP